MYEYKSDSNVSDPKVLLLNQKDYGGLTTHSMYSFNGYDVDSFIFTAPQSGFYELNFIDLYDKYEIPGENWNPDDGLPYYYLLLGGYYNFTVTHKDGNSTANSYYYYPNELVYLDADDEIKITFDASYDDTMGGMPGLTSRSGIIYYEVSISGTDETPALNLSQRSGYLEASLDYDEYNRSAFELGEFYWKVDGIIVDELTSKIEISDYLSSIINVEDDYDGRSLQAFYTYDVDGVAFTLESEVFTVAAPPKIETISYPISVIEGEAVRIDISASDLDDDALKWKYEKPEWLQVTATAKGITFEGIPQNSDVGEVELRVEAVDSVGYAASEVINFNVNNLNEAPYLISTPPILLDFLLIDGTSVLTQSNINSVSTDGLSLHVVVREDNGSYSAKVDLDTFELNATKYAHLTKEIPSQIILQNEQLIKSEHPGGIATQPYGDIVEWSTQTIDGEYFNLNLPDGLVGYDSIINPRFVEISSGFIVIFEALKTNHGYNYNGYWELTEKLTSTVASIFLFSDDKGAYSNNTVLLSEEDREYGEAFSEKADVHQNEDGSILITDLRQNSIRFILLDSEGIPLGLDRKHDFEMKVDQGFWVEGVYIVELESNDNKAFQLFNNYGEVISELYYGNWDTLTSDGDSIFISSVIDGRLNIEKLSLAEAYDTTGSSLSVCNEDQNYEYLFAAADVDADDVVTLTAETIPGWLSFDADTGILSGTPTNDEVGDHSVVLRATDGSGAYAEQSFTVSVNNINDDPFITSSAIETFNEDGSYTYTLTASDIDENDTLTLSAEALPSWLSFDAETGVLSGTPTNDAVGDHDVVLRVTDAAGEYAEQSFSVSVKPKPITKTIQAFVFDYTNLDGQVGEWDYPKFFVTDGAAAEIDITYQADATFSYSYSDYGEYFYQSNSNAIDDLSVKIKEDEFLLSEWVTAPSLVRYEYLGQNYDFAVFYQQRDIDSTTPFKQIYIPVNKDTDFKTIATLLSKQQNEQISPVKIDDYSEYLPDQAILFDQLLTANTVVQSSNSEATGDVLILGSSIVGEKLVAVDSLNDLNGTNPITYQWSVNGSVISNQSSSTLTIDESMLGKTIQVTAYFADHFGNLESATSDPTSVVINRPVGDGVVLNVDFTDLALYEDGSYDDGALDDVNIFAQSVEGLIELIAYIDQNYTQSVKSSLSTSSLTSYFSDGTVIRREFDPSQDISSTSGSVTADRYIVNSPTLGIEMVVDGELNYLYDRSSPSITLQPSSYQEISVKALEVSPSGEQKFTSSLVFTGDINQSDSSIEGTLYSLHSISLDDSFELEQASAFTGNLLLKANMLEIVTGNSEPSVTGELYSSNIIFGDGGSAQIYGLSNAAAAQIDEKTDVLSLFADPMQFPGSDDIHIKFTDSLTQDWIVSSGEGDDVITLNGGSGHLKADGGNGFDTLIIEDSFANYSITSDNSQSVFTVSSSPQKSYEIQNFERISFSDENFALNNGNFEIEESLNVSDLITVELPVLHYAASDGLPTFFEPSTLKVTFDSYDSIVYSYPDTLDITGMPTFTFEGEEIPAWYFEPEGNKGISRTYLEDGSYIDTMFWHLDGVLPSFEYQQNGIEALMFILDTDVENLEVLDPFEVASARQSSQEVPSSATFAPGQETYLVDLFDQILAIDPFNNLQHLNTAATGNITIQVDAEKGTAYADISKIEDIDGLDNANFAYQWLVDDIEIPGATLASLSLADTTVKGELSVHVSFMDDKGSSEKVSSNGIFELINVPVRPAEQIISVVDHSKKNPFDAGTIHLKYEDGTADVSSVANIYKSGSKVKSAELDVSTDGAVGISDVITQLSHIVGLDELTGIRKSSADNDADGNISISDVISSLRQIVGLEESPRARLVDQDGNFEFALDDTIESLIAIAPGDADLSWTPSDII